jgi:hypothetical protein
MKRVLAIALTALTFAPLGARAASLDVVAAPGASQAGHFATPVTIMQPGDPVRLINADLTLHSIESVDFGADDRSWCGPIDATRPEGPTNPRRYAIGKCPLFWADLIAPRQMIAVLGLDAVVAGKSYAFHDGLAQDVRGLLVVAG